MSDDVAQIHQHPFTALLPFYTQRSKAGLLRLFDHVIRQCGDMTRRCAARDHHDISDTGQFGYIQLDDVTRFQLFERIHHQ